MIGIKMCMASIVALMALCPLVHAASYNVKGAVEEILIDRTNFGQCMVAIEGFSAPGNCKNKWISLDCAGNFNSKSVGRTMLETAQIAKATGAKLQAYVNDNQLVNGRCVAYRVVLD